MGGRAGVRFFGFRLVAGVLGTGVTVLASAAPAASQEALPSYAQPAVSRDGSEIAFVSGGDIWTVPAAGGTATLLVSHEADEGMPLYSPDGTRLAFTSNRAGDDDIYVMDLQSGLVTRLTYGDAGEDLDSWSPDGEWIYFSDGRKDPGGQPDVWRIPSAGGTPMQVLADEYAPEFHAAVSPDGNRIAVAARGRMAQGQWWRNGHSHIDESEIWVATPGTGSSAASSDGPSSDRAVSVDAPSYRRLSEPGAKSVQPMWTGAGDEILYVSNRSGTENLYAQPADGGEARAVTQFEDGRLLFPAISTATDLVVFERDFGIWSLQLPDGQPTQVSITLRAATRGADMEHLSLSEDLSDLALSPDGKKVAFTARGEVFAASAEKGGVATRVTRTVAPESEITWAPDSRRIAYVSKREGSPALYLYDFGSMTESRVTSGGHSDITPRFSPDGTRIAYARNGTQVRVVTLESGGTPGDDALLAETRLWVDPFTSAEPLVWSPDGEWLGYLASDDRMFTNVWVVSASGGEAHAVSGLANSFAGSIAWDPDGETLYFDTQHRTQTGEVAAIDLVPKTPLFREDRFAELFEEDEDPSGSEPAEAGASAGNDSVSVTPVFEDIRRRLTLLPTGVDVGSLSLSPDGKTLVFTAAAEGQQNLYAFSVDPEEEGPRVTRQVTSTPGSKSRPQFTPDGKEVFFLAQGRIRAANVESGQTRTLDVTAEMDVDTHALTVEAFEQGWGYMRDHFYDEDLHGADWETIRTDFEPHIRGARTQAEYSRLMNMMLGELNGSHLGHTVRSDREGPDTGVLGLSFDRAEYESAGRLRITEVLPLGPAAVSRGIAVGDYLVSVAGTAIDASTNLYQLLQETQGDKVALTVSGNTNGSNARDVSVRPIDTQAERQLEYRNWVETNRAYVERVSEGRLGYVHMPNMGAGALRQLYVDLDAANHGREGVVIDIRNNNGGFVNAYALDAFARRGYMTMQIRGGYPEANARSMLGQRSLERGTALVVNQHTLSDGEDFTEGYRTLELGPVVGEPTAGWIIFTWGTTLVDGSNLRMPRARIRGADGENMELNPRPVDIEVIRPMGESYTGRDSQLDAAVDALLGRGS